MYIYNITFVMEHAARARFVGWIKATALPALCGEADSTISPRLMEVEEVGGEKPGADHGLSMALHLELPSEAEAHAWHDGKLVAVLSDFYKEFGPQAVFFVTLLKTVPL